MKSSRFNHLFQYDDGLTLFFNSATGALAEIDDETLPQITAIVNTSDNAITTIDKDLLGPLEAGGYIVDDECDEVADMEKKSNHERFSNRSLMLTIAPTLACNFGCEYCFETAAAIKMDNATEEALIRFADKQMAGAEDCIITWFGGEPTLGLDLIERVQERLREMAQSHGVTMRPGSIISNGYLLDAAMARRLRAAGVMTAQVTLDGPQELHDSRRPLRNGRGSFERIVANLEEVADILAVAVRINIDRDNMTGVCDLVESLYKKGIGGKMDIHFARVNSSGGACANIRDRCFADEEFAHLMVLLYRQLHDRGIWMSDYPQVFAGGHCGAVCERASVISPTGDIFRCWEELSADGAGAVGTIFDDAPTNEQAQIFESYMKWNPFDRRDCRMCSVLPICMGGCPIQSGQTTSVEHGICAPWKFNLKDMLVIRHTAKAQKEVTA